MSRYRVAVGTTDGIEITEHFGRAESFWIYEIDRETDEIAIADKRIFAPKEGACGDESETPAHDGGSERFAAVSDCNIVLVAQIGFRSQKTLTLKQIVPLERTGDVSDALARVAKSYKRRGTGTRSGTGE
ncbi:MAG: hypothetical protein LBS90_05820 [Oscillospiraceae bacterium]|jgi:predicted Fe-Mo cluster-binding NifX family protein|nr:hypothetical protein [Oscillospiraceae bacterium]